MGFDWAQSFRNTQGLDALVGRRGIVPRLRINCIIYDRAHKYISFLIFLDSESWHSQLKSTPEAGKESVFSCAR
jgi:hypothetical protein